MKLRAIGRYSDNNQPIWVDVRDIANATVKPSAKFKHEAEIVITTNLNTTLTLGWASPMSLFIDDAIKAATLLNQLAYHRDAKQAGNARTLTSWYEFASTPLSRVLSDRVPTHAETTARRKALAEQRQAEAAERAKALADMGITSDEIDAADNQLAAA